jgi:hypothetical protein
MARMKIIVRGVLGLLGVGVLLFLIQGIAAETGGEVVVIHIANEQGEEQSTRIWVMDLDGKLYVRGGEGSWPTRAIAHPDLKLERAAGTLPYKAVRLMDQELHGRLNRLFRDEYGFGDAIISYMVGDPERLGAVILELVPPGA